MTDTSTATPVALLGLGFLLGLRHALDVDHLAAVSTIVSQGRGLWRSSLVGAIWGLGHTAALLVVAIAVVGLHAEMPAALGHALELGVAVMLVVLGSRLLWSLARGARLHVHPHEHDGVRHVHPHLHADAEHHDHVPHRRPFLIGCVHGMAGSAGLMLAVAATISDPALALLYVAAFGLGSVGGMMAMSTLLGVPLALAGARFARAETGLRVLAGLASVGVGVQLAIEIGRDAGFLA
ncbi:MAG: urease accessory protein [bacterium]|nr:urease accessory protein [bacterium]